MSSGDRGRMHPDRSVMKKVIFIIGLAIGYVLGSRAGRARYDQIASAAASLWQSKPVQQQVGKVEESVKVLSAKAGDAALDGVKNLTNRVVDSKKSSAAQPSAPRGTQSSREATTN